MRALMLVAVLAGGCLRSTEFHCADSAQCSGGTCQPEGFCSFTDTECASGQRFADSAGGHAGQCVGGSGSDGGVDDAPVDDAMIDAPIDAPTMMCPASYMTVTGSTHVYRLIAAQAVWDSQRTACAADGANAYLAIPNDAAELMAFNTLAPANTDYWVGVGDAATEGTYLNVKGAAQTFLPWDTGQPNNFGDADCVQVHQNNRSFNDFTCGMGLRAICECEP